MSNPVTSIFGDKRWFNEAGEYHRVDGPAIVYENGDMSWYLNGERHRSDGPAVVVGTNSFWYFHGCRYRNLNDFCAVAGITGKHKTMMLLKYSQEFA